MNSILIIAAHPDDEVLGCGGTIARHVQQGDDVQVLILAEGVTSRDEKRDRKIRKNGLSHLSKAAHKAHNILGTTSLKLLGFPDNRMDSVDLLDIVKAVEDEVARISPNTVYTHHIGDLNIDHRVTHQAAITACRPTPGQSVQKILSFEVPSSTEWQTPGAENAFIPNCFVDISSTLEQKLQCLEAYESEMKPWPHSRSSKAVEYLARWRGASVGLEAAEAFKTVREVVR